MAKRITRLGNIDQVTDTILYTAVVGGATLLALSMNVQAGGTITVSKYEAFTTLTTVLYAVVLDPGSQLTDTDAYPLLIGDYIKVLSSNPGSTFLLLIDIP